jgi:hypothetical protein
LRERLREIDRERADICAALDKLRRVLPQDIDDLTPPSELEKAGYGE